MAGPNSESCETCYYVRRTEKQTNSKGQHLWFCCRYPPNRVSMSNDGSTGFPILWAVKANWCGEYRPMVSDELIEQTKEWAEPKNRLDNNENDG